MAFIWFTWGKKCLTVSKTIMNKKLHKMGSDQLIIVIITLFQEESYIVVCVCLTF